MFLTLHGKPKSTSHIYKYTNRGGYVSGYMSKEGKELKEQYEWEIKSQYRGGPIITEELQVELHFYHADKRKRDVDNFNKLVLDALSGIVYADDSQIKRLIVEKFIDKENPRVDIHITQR